MNYIRAAFTVLIFVHLSSLPADAQNGEALEAYYFFSPACPRCERIAPFIRELSREFCMRGFFHGKGDVEPMPFEVREADNVALLRYGVRAFPSLAIMKNGAVKQLLSGEQDINDARLILSAYRKGAWSASEVIEKKPPNKVRVIGWVVSKGEYFHSPQFYLTDRRQVVLIRPWLPIDAVRSPFKKTRPRLMSDVIDKPIFLEGTTTDNDGILEFTVGKELSFE
jgi:thiol-disulfide isomerase/thioredoxin